MGATVVIIVPDGVRDGLSLLDLEAHLYVCVKHSLRLALFLLSSFVYLLFSFFAVLKIMACYLFFVSPISIVLLAIESRLKITYNSGLMGYRFHSPYLSTVYEPI